MLARKKISCRTVLTFIKPEIPLPPLTYATRDPQSTSALVSKHVYIKGKIVINSE